MIGEPLKKQEACSIFRINALIFAIVVCTLVCEKQIFSCHSSFLHFYMSHVVRKPTFWFSTWSDTNQVVQLQKVARGLKFRFKEVEGLYYPCSENKGADQLRGYRKADLRLCFLMTRLTWSGNRGPGQGCFFYVLVLHMSRVMEKICFLHRCAANQRFYCRYIYSKIPLLAEFRIPSQPAYVGPGRQVYSHDEANMFRTRASPLIVI